MKPTRLLLLLLLVWQLDLLAPTARAEEAKAEPAPVTLEECSEIFVIVGPRWALRIRRDGSGVLNYAKTEDFLLPKGTFDLAKVYRPLAEAAKVTDDSGSSVVFVQSGPMRASKKQVARTTPCLRDLRQTAESALAKEDVERFQKTKTAHPFEE